MQVEVDRLLLLVEVRLLQAHLLGFQLVEIFDLRRGVGEVAAHRNGDEDGDHHHELGRGVPGARILPVGPLEFLGDRIEVDGSHG